MNQPVSFSFAKHLSENPDFFQYGMLEKISTAEETFKTRNGPYMKWLDEPDDDGLPVVQEHQFSTGIPTWSRTFNDFSGGLAFLAGQPNFGKSTIMINLMKGLITNNDDVIVVDLTLDDSIGKRFVQHISCITGLHYQKVQSQKSLDKREREIYEAGKAEYYRWIAEKRYWLFAGEESFNYQVGNKTKVIDVTMSTFRTLRGLATDLRKTFPDKKIVVFVDAFNDLDPESSEFGELDRAVRTTKAVFVKENVAGVISTHLRKVQQRATGRLTLDDIKGTKEMEYSGQWAGILHNPWRQNSLNTDMILARDGKIFGCVVVEVPKSKVSSFDSPLIMGVDGGRGQLIPLTRNEYLNLYLKWMSRNSDNGNK